MAGSSNRPRRRGPEPFEARREQGFDRLLEVGRQLVDGVAGARPGSRPGGRFAAGRAGGGGGLGGLGRWMEGRLDWLLEDEDDWREPWQEPSRSQGPSPSVGRRADGWSAAAATDRQAPFRERLSRDDGRRDAAFRDPASRDGSYGDEPAWGSDSMGSAFRESPPRRVAPLPLVTPRSESAWAGGPDPGRRRQPLEAISRRATPLLPPVPGRAAQLVGEPQSDPGRPQSSRSASSSIAASQSASPPGGSTSFVQPGPYHAEADDWPNPDDFSVPRWQRPARSVGPEPERSGDRSVDRGGPGGRPLPRSTRRRG